MNLRRKSVALATLIAAGISTALIAPATATISNAIRDIAEVQGLGDTDVVNHTYKVYAPSIAHAENLAKLGYDLLEDRDGDYLFVAGTPDIGARLKGHGFKATIDSTLTATWKSPGGRIGNPDPNAEVEDTFYGGYHTAQGHLNHIDQVAQRYPHLARKFTIGKTYTGKYDLNVLCITKGYQGDCELKTNSNKPKFFLMTQTHAREIASGEMAYRFIDHLTQNYETDAEVRNILDTTEIWVLPSANPDGLDKVAQGSRPSMQRKNRNPTNGNCRGDKVGVDLNRNNGSHWGGASTSKDPCSDIYLGPRADSEPENQALQALWRKIFRNNGTGGNSAVPTSATGYMLSIHTVAGMNLVPWQYANKPAPNDRSLKAIGQQMKSYNGYRTGQAPQLLYAASGGHDDWIYEKLGVASATIELGGPGECGGRNFHPSYRCVDTYWNANKPVLMYLAKIASRPYAAGFGPNVRTVDVDGITVSATIDAKEYEKAAQGERSITGGDVASVEYSYDRTFTQAHTMDLVIEGNTATATAKATNLGRSTGRHMVYVRAKDKAGNYGPVTASWIG